ncbi:pancreatic secretory granule membrane major glycoprotein GP2-like isoform X2 [Ascaphus truei]|uniref:pancreatic secretory granule membrane major glycoprotein GP2-like isoform X2 n=1 Tax=Ascaphus truei TaxID=8439 RepID=UPI003F59D34F
MILYLNFLELLGQTDLSRRRGEKRSDMNFLCVLVVAAVLRETGAVTCYAGADPPQCSAASCGGSCDSENGCNCIDGTTLCIPTTQCSANDSTCCPTGLFWFPSDSCCTTKLNCAPACLSDEVCANVSGIATCQCNTTTYAGKNRSALVPLVKCEADTMTVSLSKCLLEYIGYDTKSFKLNDNSDSCTTTYSDVINNQRVQSIQAIPRTGWCGNVVTMDSSKVNYINSLHIGVQNKSIVTANPLNLTFSCAYNLTMQTSLAAALRPLLSTVNLTASGEGSAPTTMAAYWDQAYTRPIQSSEEVLVGSDVFLGLFSSAVDGDKFALRVEKCFATPDGDANNVNKVPLVSGGCPANQGVSTEVQQNGAALEARIKISSFAFQGQAQVFISCEVRLCDKNGTCTGCTSGRAASDAGDTLQIVVNLRDDNSYSSSGSHTAVSWAVLAASLLGPLCTKLF